MRTTLGGIVPSCLIYAFARLGSKALRPESPPDMPKCCQKQQFL
jgi:hypothetical protein